MKALAVVAVMLVGCASASGAGSGADQQLARIEQQRRNLERSEQRCIDDASAGGRGQIVLAGGAPSASSVQQTIDLKDETDRRIAECRAIFDRESDQLSAGERAAYQAQGEEEQNRNSLTVILTAARPH